MLWTIRDKDYVLISQFLFYMFVDLILIAKSFIGWLIIMDKFKKKQNNTHTNKLKRTI